MSSTPKAHARPRFNVGWGAAVSAIGFAVAWIGGLPVAAWGFGILTVVLLIGLVWRTLADWRRQLLWPLRNRLLVAYLLVGLIPVVLLLLLGLVAAWTLYGKVAVYQVTDRLERLEAELQDRTSDLASALGMAAALEGRLRPEVVARILEIHGAAAREQWPGSEVHLLGGPAPPPSGLPAQPGLPAWLRSAERFAGVVMGEDAALLVARPVEVSRESLTLVWILPLDERILAYLSEDIGRVSLFVLREQNAAERATRRPIRVGDKDYAVLKGLEDQSPLPTPLGWWDSKVSFLASQPTTLRETGQPGPPLVLRVESRVATVHLQLTRRLGEFSGIPFAVMTAIAILFLVLELVALRIGIRLTRTITGTVDDLQTATERVQAADFSHRIRVRGRDQLSGLAQTFNSMTSSIEGLIEESKDRQRLQNDLEIARHVQEQLFPRETPELKTLELVGRCRAARTVSGDYYDYGLLEPGKLIFTIGDVSGKGISAALLMATIQSILRSHAYAGRLAGRSSELNAAELVTRVNRQLCATTSAEKYSSLFVAHYDDAARCLTYTNAGHLPPVLLRRGHSQLLEAGGMVVGLFPQVSYEQATLELEPGDWLVAFTDGLTEVENSYEEEYGSERVIALLERTFGTLSPDRLVDRLLAELQEWAPGLEQRDDCTILAARVR
jgi:sigma-B regulation protein RsbU (phosphoserine phosphatase)